MKSGALVSPPNLYPPWFGGIKFFAESVHRSGFAAHTQSFLHGKFSTARLKVLPNLRHVGVFQMSTMVNLGIGFQEPLTRPGVRLDEKMSNYSSDSERSRWIYKFQLAGKWSESKKMSYHAILKNLYGPKMDVILTISFKITAEIEIRKHMFCLLLRWRGVSAL